MPFERWLDSPVAPAVAEQQAWRFYDWLRECDWFRQPSFEQFVSESEHSLIAHKCPKRDALRQLRESARTCGVRRQLRRVPSAASAHATLRHVAMIPALIDTRERRDNRRHRTDCALPSPRTEQPEQCHWLAMVQFRGWNQAVVASHRRSFANPTAPSRSRVPEPIPGNSDSRRSGMDFRCLSKYSASSCSDSSFELGRGSLQPCLPSPQSA